MDDVIKVARQHGYKLIAKGTDMEPGVYNALFAHKPKEVVEAPDKPKAKAKAKAKK